MQQKWFWAFLGLLVLAFNWLTKKIIPPFFAFLGRVFGAIGVWIINGFAAFGQLIQGNRSAPVLLDCAKLVALLGLVAAIAAYAALSPPVSP